MLDKNYTLIMTKLDSFASMPRLFSWGGSRTIICRKHGHISMKHDHQGSKVKPSGEHNHNMKEAWPAMESSMTTTLGSTSIAARTNVPIKLKHKNHQKEAYHHHHLVVSALCLDDTKPESRCRIVVVWKKTRSVCDSLMVAACIEAWCSCNKQVDLCNYWSLWNM
jgi:hypothetical protein